VRETRDRSLAGCVARAKRRGCSSISMASAVARGCRAPMEEQPSRNAGLGKRADSGGAPAVHPGKQVV
jgi:hypothetical protein